MMDTQRLVLFFVFGFSLLMLWDAWEKEHRPKPAPQAQSAATVPTPAGKPTVQPGAAMSRLATAQRCDRSRQKPLH